LSNILSSKRASKYLSLEDEVELFSRYNENKSPKVLNEITESYLSFVRFITKQYYSYNLEFEDLFQQGLIGLLKAIERFDIDKKIRFTSFAAIYVKSEIISFIHQNTGIVRIITKKSYAKIYNNYAKYAKSTRMTIDEMRIMAKDLDVPLEDVKDIDGYMAFNDISFDTPLASEEDSMMSLHDSIAGVEDCEYVLMREHDDSMREYDKVMRKLRRSINNLGEREKEIFTARRLVDEPRILEDLAAEYGVSAERIRQIEVGAFKKIKQKFVPLQ
jgi:RNA polymerase sigma-32 factor